MPTPGVHPQAEPRKTPSPAEHTVWRAHRDHLPRSWSTWHSLRPRGRNNSDGVRDFILAAPDRGFLALEEKTRVAHFAHLAQLTLLLLALLLVASCNACEDDPPAIRAVTPTAPQEPSPAEPSPTEPSPTEPSPAEAPSRWGERPSWAVQPSGPALDPLPRFGGVWVRRHVEMAIEEMIDNEEQWGDYRVTSCVRVFSAPDGHVVAEVETAEYRLNSCSFLGPAHLADDGALVVRSESRAFDFDVPEGAEPVEGPYCWLRLERDGEGMTVRGLWPDDQCRADLCGYHGAFDEEDRFPLSGRRQGTECPDEPVSRIGAHVFAGE